MDTFSYYLQMALSYGIALSQVAMYIFIAVFLAKVGTPAAKALKTYAENNKACTCDCGCNEAAAPAPEEPKAQ